MRIYVQYSYGGYSIYYADNSSEEILNKEVTTDNDYNFPNYCYSFFQNAGCKIAYWKMPNEEYDLVVNGIVCKEKPDLRCSVQFLGETDDKITLDNLTNRVLNELDGFSNFFASLFEKRDGLYMKKNDLFSYIEECKEQKYYNQEISECKNDIKIFVPATKKINDTSAQLELTTTFFNRKDLRFNKIGSFRIDNVFSLEKKEDWERFLPGSKKETGDNNDVDIKKKGCLRMSKEIFFFGDVQLY